MSKARAAKIANSPEASKHGGKKSGKGGDAEAGRHDRAAQGRRSQGREGRGEEEKGAGSDRLRLHAVERRARAGRRSSRNAARAEAAGFDFASISDHYHPWVCAQGHSPFVWSVLGGDRREHRTHPRRHRRDVPDRAHPSGGDRPGGGHHVAALRGALLPRARHRRGAERARHRARGGRRRRCACEMLEEAVAIIRACSPARPSTTAATYYEVDNARLFDPPTPTSRSSSPGSARRPATLAGRIGDGFWGNAPDRELLDAFEDAAGRARGTRS